MPRPVSKTYGRNGTSAGGASNAFDDAVRRASGRDKVFSDVIKNNKMSTAMATTQMKKFGNTSFTSTRKVSTPVQEVESRKRPADDLPLETSLFDDPFSFDSEDDGPKRPKKGAAFKKAAKIDPVQTGKGSKGSRNNSCNSVDSQENGKSVASSSTTVSKSNTAVKLAPDLENAISMIGKKQPTMDSSLSTTVSKSGPAVKLAPDLKNAISMIGKKKPTMDSSLSTTVSKSGTAVKLAPDLKTAIGMIGKKQPTMDSFMLKITTSRSTSSSKSNSTATAGSFSANFTSVVKEKKSTAKDTSQKKSVKKFFTSKNKNPVDHNYSASLSSTQSQMRDDHCYSQLDSFAADSPASKDVWSSDFDSDWDVESGDPEIVFNTPKKKALAAQARACATIPAAQPTKGARNLIKDLARDSPITISSDAEDDRSSLCSNASVKSNKTGPLFVSNLDHEPADDLDMPTFKPFPQKRAIRTYGKGRNTDSSSVTSSVGSEEQSLSLSQGQGQDLYSGLTNKKASVPGLRKYSSLNETDSTQKKAMQSKPTRRLLTSPSKAEAKVKAVYNPRSWQVGSDGVSDSQKTATSSSNLFDDFDAEPEPVKVQPLMKRSLKKPVRPWDDTVSSLKVSRDHKPLFTVVRNVKQAHECQEHGETQEFEDDILYILDGMDDTSSVSTRCLSTISLASKCTMPSFRMHLRAHNTLSVVFGHLHDAHKYPTLALCTAAVMFMMSRDRMNLDLEKSSLQLMLALLSVNSQQMAHSGDKSEQKEYDRLCKRVQEITHTLRQDGGVKNNKLLELALEDVSIGYLAMETLLSLTAKNAGDWFKEELRTQGGLDHIINTVSNCSEELGDYVIEPTESMLEKFTKIDRCLRVLANVTYMNSENQTYLITYKSSLLTISLYKILRVCENCMPFNQIVTIGEDKIDKDCPGAIIYSCALSVLRVMIDLTHDNIVGSTKTGQLKGLMATVLSCILRVPQYVPLSERFDMLVLSLGLLINMVEKNDGNKHLLLETKTNKPYGTLSVVNTQVPALEALSLLFVQCHEAARLMEEEHDAELEERERLKDGGRALAPPPQSSQRPGDPNKSGEWKESEAGLEWVVLPVEDEAETDPDKILERGGTLRDALRNHYNQDRALEEPGGDGDSDDLEVIPASQEEDENFTKALHKYGRHMEDSIVAAYTALLLGCIIDGDSYLADKVQDFLPGCSFEGMIRMLKKFLGFMNFTSSMSNTGSKSIKRVIEILEAHADS